MSGIRQGGAGLLGGSVGERDRAESLEREAEVAPVADRTSALACLAGETPSLSRIAFAERHSARLMSDNAMREASPVSNLTR